jgi:hypothetical protein
MLIYLHSRTGNVPQTLLVHSIRSHYPTSTSSAPNAASNSPPAAGLRSR